MDSKRGRIPALIAGGATPGTEGRRLTPVDIQSKEFRLALRGYNEREVDQFLDELTEEMARLHAENKRLREELELKGTVRLDSAVVNEGDEILRRAREQAARIVAEAEAESARRRAEHEAGAPTAPAAGVASVPFLARERDFLQRLAGAIQDHAHAVRDEIRRTREGEGAGTSGAGSGAGGPAPASRSEESEGSPQDLGVGDGSDAGPPTQTWTPDFASAAGEEQPWPPETSEPGEAGPQSGEMSSESTVGSSPGPGAGLASDQPAIVIAPIEAPPSQEPTGPLQKDPNGGDRSLRELFWGED